MLSLQTKKRKKGYLIACPYISLTEFLHNTAKMSSECCWETLKIRIIAFWNISRWILTMLDVTPNSLASEVCGNAEDVQAGRAAPF